MCLIYLLLFGCGGCCGSAQESARCGCGQDAVAERRCGCCRCSACTGFGRHGNGSVCCDEAYYVRQYALCCKCTPCCKN